MGQGVTGSSMLRNQAVILEGVPDAYAGLRNPLPRTRATIERGAAVYARSCAACHGDTGLGDGPAGRALAHPPANLAWLSRMPVRLWDPFMYWTIADGGAILHTAMPSFKASLSEKDSWAVIAYIQARLPRRKSR
jgi:mono/diheme cytochrome c family protein